MTDDGQVKIKTGPQGMKEKEVVRLLYHGLGAMLQRTFEMTDVDKARANRLVVPKLVKTK